LLTTYRLLKNRKSARKSRRRRKAELTTLREEVKMLRDECERLKKIAAPFINKGVNHPSSGDEKKTPFGLPFFPNFFNKMAGHQ